MTPKSPQASYQSGEPGPFLRLELRRGEIYLLPYGSLIFAHLTPETGSDQHDLLELAFASHDVTVTGFKLAEVAQALQGGICQVIREGNSSKAAFDDRPGVLSITVKQAGANA